MPYFNFTLPLVEIGMEVSAGNLIKILFIVVVQKQIGGIQYYKEKET